MSQGSCGKGTRRRRSVSRREAAFWRAAARRLRPWRCVLLCPQMLVDDIGDVTITNDGATILKQLEIEHPAAKVRAPSRLGTGRGTGSGPVLHTSSSTLLGHRFRCLQQLRSVQDTNFELWFGIVMQILVELAELQDSEVGDGTTSVVILAAELLRRANELVRNKIHPTNIISGYRLAMREVGTRACATASSPACTRRSAVVR